MKGYYLEICISIIVFINCVSGFSLSEETKSERKGKLDLIFEKMKKKEIIGDPWYGEHLKTIISDVHKKNKEIIGELSEIIKYERIARNRSGYRFVHYHAYPFWRLGGNIEVIRESLSKTNNLFKALALSNILLIYPEERDIELFSSLVKKYRDYKIDKEDKEKNKVLKKIFKNLAYCKKWKEKIRERSGNTVKSKIEYVFSCLKSGYHIFNKKYKNKWYFKTPFSSYPARDSYETCNYIFKKISEEKPKQVAGVLFTISKLNSYKHFGRNPTEVIEKYYLNLVSDMCKSEYDKLKRE